MSHETEVPMRFQLNMRMIADALEREFKQIEFYSSGDSCRFNGVKIFYPPGEMQNCYVYFIRNHDIQEDFAKYEGIAFVIIGKADFSLFPKNSPIIQVIDESDFLDIYNIVQDTFERYKKWDWQLQRAVYSPHPLDEIVQASMEVFRNPMFIHDTNFFILADPRHAPGMLTWETDPRTGRKMVPMSLINDFMVDMDYLEGMKETKPTMYPAEQRGYRILYANLWNDGHYEGRILVDEIQSVIQPGDFCAMEYLEKYVEMCIRNEKIVWMSLGNDADRFFHNFLSEQISDERQVMNFLHFLCWNRNDRYLCLCMVADQKEFGNVSSLVTLGQIEAQISAGQAILYEGSITVIVNLSYTHSTAAETMSKLAVILREGLLKVGISSEINDFMLLPQAFRQARVALDFGRVSGSTCWYYYFDDYILEYMIESAGRDIPLHLLCSEALHKLRRYDEKNHTELYLTLKTYLRLERNALQTAKSLFIHRTTLFYRLERIHELTGVDLDDPKERLKLLISYYMSEKSENF